MKRRTLSAAVAILFSLDLMKAPVARRGFPSVWLTGWGLLMPTLLWWFVLFLDHSLHWSARSGPYSGWFLLAVVTAIGGATIFLVRWHLGVRLALFAGYVIAMGAVLAVAGICLGCALYGDCP
jgi:hypothetical protein